jgi:hypothetical protein
VETTLPISHNRDLDWIAVALRTDLSSLDQPLNGSLVVPYRVHYFDTVPDNEMWLYERILCQVSLRPSARLDSPADRKTPSVVGTLRLFLDDDRTLDTAAMYDPSRFLAGVDFPHSIELLDSPHPVQVPGGSRLGVLWTSMTFPQDGIALTMARANVLALRHQGTPA